MASHASSGTRIEERERRVYKDAHAAQFVKIRHFPALSQVTSSGDNIILLQDAMDNAETNAHRSTRQSLRMERIQSRVGDADASFQALLGPKSMLNEFRGAVLCKHTKARDVRDSEGFDDASPRPAPNRRPRPVFNAGSASEAKSRIARPKDYDYPTGIHSREDRVLSPAQQALVDEARAMDSKPTWATTNATKARGTIEASYYMNSPMHDMALDRKYIKQIIRMTVRGGGAGLDASSSNAAAHAQVLH
ncbi:hypothetical protein H257_10121 [Aphanomyces astaci]|uniref:Uncharacterized protein n=1 Tax=Aphanomyces astaci TaxID=112090 RepID=W4G7R3_APHAT|nr:hypothetical protein H257_10121 [Aphanomyces astaci]ETV75747.1 hypothetical protein H257_10121 [Aphanomyces astaci]|eukprot:XP_009834878.1 hypothetical protein H257_10121 [Aphanomyces astaci]